MWNVFTGYKCAADDSTTSSLFAEAMSAVFSFQYPADHRSDFFHTSRSNKEDCKNKYCVLHM